MVGTDGSVDWLCLPRFDSAACFAKLLGDEDNGHWLIAPKGAERCTRRAYRPDTLVLDTEWGDRGRLGAGHRPDAPARPRPGPRTHRGGPER
ncbi:DUF5911 domain-containing protein [Streptomyces thinghirensis]|nr:DUF5911 domain-containing protein [Streptomyces thinghirensis]